MCVYMYVHARACQILSDCIVLRRCLRRITFEIVVVDPHTHIHTRTYIYTTVTIQEDYIDWYARRKREKEREREKNICITVIQLVLITRVFNEYTFLLYFFSSSFHNIRCTYKKKRQRRSIRRSFK